MFIDSVPHKEISEYYVWADVFVLPSITDWKGEKEGLGVVILEAFASGIPVIGTQSGGIVDVVKHRVNGFLVPERDAPAIAKYLMNIYHNRELAVELGQRGREFVKTVFTREKIADRLTEMYMKSLKRSSRR